MIQRGYHAKCIRLPRQVDRRVQGIFTRIAASDIRSGVEDQYSKNRYWPEPLIQINPHYQRRESVQSLADTWPDLAMQKLSIKDVADYYAQMGYFVEILTGDQGLKAYEPSVPAEIPRRGQRR